MIDLPEYVLDLLNGIAKSEGFTEYKFEIKPGSNDGDNFSGILTCVAVRGVRLINNIVENDELHLLCKLPPSSAARRQQFLSIQFFEREVHVYNKVLPLFENFQKEKGLSESDSFISFPKCYAAIANKESDQYVVIMRDLRPDGFVMRPKHIIAPVNHIYKIYGELAKLHALSFALKDQRPDAYAELKQTNDFLRKLFASNSPLRSMFGYDRAIAALKDTQHIAIANDLKANISEFLEDCLGDGVCEPFGVFCHADCHYNNFLFLYDEKTKHLKDFCLLDWQLSSFRSPVMDILYLLCGATDKPFRDREYRNLLKHYHRTLSNMLNKLGSDADKLFSFDDLESQLKKFGKFAFVTGPLCIQLTLVNPNDVANLDDIVQSGDTNADFIAGFDAETQIEYDKRINGLFSDLIEFGYFWK